MSTVVTTLGPVVGATDDGIHSFQGVPYAAPPVGDRRFSHPEPHRPWSEPRSAAAPGPAAPQVANALAGLVPGMEVDRIDEDCLTVNVWTPDPSGDRPMLVWLHGGGFSLGSSSQANYDGARLARRGERTGMEASGMPMEKGDVVAAHGEIGVRVGVDVAEPQRLHVVSGREPEVSEAEVLAASRGQSAAAAQKKTNRAAPILSSRDINHPGDQVVLTVAVDVSGGKDCPEPELDGPRRACDASGPLAPQLRAEGRQADRRTTEQDDTAGVRDAAGILKRYADRQVGVPVTVEVADGQRPSEPVSPLIAAGHSFRALMPHLVTGRREPSWAAIQHLHSPGVLLRPDVLLGDSHRKVGIPIRIEVIRSQ